MPTNYAQQTEPQLSILDYTIDRLDPGGLFRQSIDSALKPLGAELVEFDVDEPQRDQDGFAFSQVRNGLLAFKVDLEQDDTFGVVRSKIANALRAAAERVEGK